MIKFLIASILIILIVAACESNALDPYPPHQITIEIGNVSHGHLTGYVQNRLMDKIKHFDVEIVNGFPDKIEWDCMDDNGDYISEGVYNVSIFIDNNLIMEQNVDLTK